MQRSILCIQTAEGTLTQGCHWCYGDDLTGVLNTHYANAVAARGLVCGNRINSISADGEVERNTSIYPPRTYKDLRTAAKREECITVHTYHAGQWHTLRQGIAHAPRTLRFTSDPGHGWLHVPRIVAEAVLTDEFKKLTPYSYQRGDMVYLEEDLDAYTFLRAAKRKGLDFKVDQSSISRQSRIRGYESLTHV